MTYRDESQVCAEHECGSSARLHLAGGVLAVQFDAVGPYVPRIEFCFRDRCLHMVHSLEKESMGVGNPEACIGIVDPDTGVKLEVESDPFGFALVSADGRTLLHSAPGQPHFMFHPAPEGGAFQFTLNLGSSASDYYGFGERFDSLDQNGLNPDVCVVNQYCKQGNRTYIPMPFFVTEAGYGMHVVTDRYVRFGLAPRLPGTMVIEAQIDPGRPSLQSTVFLGTPADIVRAYSRSTGVTALPPKWAFGPWMSGNAWDTQREVEEQLRLSDELGLPATVVVIEAWSDEATFYVWNDAQHAPEPGDHAFQLDEFTFPAEGKWPDPKALADRVHDSGMKLVLWQIPVLKRLAAHEPRCTQHERDEEHAIARGYVVRNADGTPYRIPDGWFAGSLLLDFTNPEAARWWFGKRRYLIDQLGVDGFKTDGGEFIFDDRVAFWDGRDGASMRNRYAMTYIEAYRDFAGPGRITFSRAGHVGAQSSGLFWAGDQESSFAESRAVLTAGLSIGLSGVPFWGFDMAGLSGEIPTAELFIRALEMAAFSPVMQYHSDGPAAWDRTPWNIAARTGDERVVPTYRSYANLRMNLLPYIYNEAVNSAKSAEPLMRAPMIDFPDDPASFSIDDQYMFGRDLLVAPMLHEHRYERPVHLPPGRWLDFWTLEETGAGPCTIPSYPGDVERIPVFIRKGAILPINLGDSMHLGSPTGVRGVEYRNLSFLVTGTPAQEWIFTDDEGARIRFSPNDDGLHIIADAVGTLRHVHLLVLESGRCQCASRRSRAVWATGGSEARVVRCGIESLMQGILLPL